MTRTATAILAFGLAGLALAQPLPAADEVNAADMLPVSLVRDEMTGN